jgi:hypothetical protein
MKKIIPGILCSWYLLVGYPVEAQSVWTQHNDQARTGWYPYETILNTGNVNTNTFGLINDHVTDDKVVSQPLVIVNVNIPGFGTRNILLVTTLNNTIYCYDADMNVNPYWTVNYTNKNSSSGADCNSCRPARSLDMHPSLCGGTYYDFPVIGAYPGNLGIVGTPVVDTTAGTMYFVTKIVNTNDAGYDNHAYTGGTNPNTNTLDEYSYTVNGFHQYLHAVDITTGTERSGSPVEITATATGTGDTGDGHNANGIVTFDPRRQFNRAGLVLSQGTVYVAFAAHCDFNPSHGWIMSYGTTVGANFLHQIASYCTTPNDGRGGIWMAGGAPAVDVSNGHLYVSTGNSLNEDGSQATKDAANINIYNVSPTNNANRGQSVIELAPDLTFASTFTPFNYQALNDADLDFPIQTMLLPNTTSVMTGCKDGNIYVMTRGSLGGYSSSGNNNLQIVAVGGATATGMHSSFAYFGGPTPLVYQYSENTSLKAYPVLANNKLDNSPAHIITNTSVPGPAGATGAWLSVSSNGTDPATGILWAAQAAPSAASGKPSALHAFKASDITTELWNSNLVSSGSVTSFNKFTCPTIALGKVYLSTNYNHVYVYGLQTNTTCLTNVALNKLPVVASNTGPGQTNFINDGMTGSYWASGLHDNDWVYIDLGARYDLCRISINWQSQSTPNPYWGNYGQDFDIRVSDDHVTWTTVTQFRGNSALYSETNTAATGRYVAMFGIKRPDPTYPYGIWEFQAYGSLANPCATPSGLAASLITANTAHLSWSAVSGVTNYTINYNSTLEQSSVTKTSNTNSIDLAALSCGVGYTYTVQANCGATPSGIATGTFTAATCSSSCDLPETRHYNLDLGDIGAAGSTCRTGTIYKLTASGTDIGGISDQFQFEFTNDGLADDDLIAEITQQDLVPSTNKVGIMVRDSLTNTSRFAYLYSVNDGNSFVFEYRAAAGGFSQVSGTLTGLSLPYWVKISKSGTNYSAYISPNGSAPWTKLGSTVNLNFGSTNIGNPPNYGLAVTSTVHSTLSSGTFNNFTLGPSSGPLPILLINFAARKINDHDVLVSWTTTMEHLVDHFEVQRSADNAGFQTIAIAATDGESQIARNYAVDDNKPETGWNYYRMKEIDRDGKFYYSPVAAVNINGSKEPVMSPNPADAFTNINAGLDPLLSVRLYDATGKMLQNIQTANGTTNIKLNTADLMKGVYFVTIKTTTSIYRKKLIKD